MATAKQIRDVMLRSADGAVRDCPEDLNERAHVRRPPVRHDDRRRRRRDRMCPQHRTRPLELSSRR